MKLHEYLKQFEGLDPELEVYKNDPPTEDWESETQYPQAIRIDEKPFSLVYADSLDKTTFFVRSSGELSPRFEQLIILV